VNSDSSLLTDLWKPREFMAEGRRLFWLRLLLRDDTDRLVIIFIVGRMALLSRSLKVIMLLECSETGVIPLGFLERTSKVGNSIRFNCTLPFLRMVYPE